MRRTSERSYSRLRPSLRTSTRSSSAHSTRPSSTLPECSSIRSPSDRAPSDREFGFWASGAGTASGARHMQSAKSIGCFRFLQTLSCPRESVTDSPAELQPLVAI